MAEKNVKRKRMDWYKTFPRDLGTSMNYRLMTPAQRGAYRDLLDACWINFPDVSYPYNEEMIREVCNIRTQDAWDAIMPKVLARFELIDGRLYNEKLRVQVDEALEDSENARIKLAARKDREKPTFTEPDVYSSTTPVQQEYYSSARIREDKIREDKRREEEISVGDLLATMNSRTNDPELGGIEKGKPGHFHRGQYPARSAKAIFSWMAKAWSKLKGEAAYLRYPSKFPEAWEQLCDQKSADLLVPAFELWIVKHALHERVDWPLQDFMKVAQEFMACVIPLNEAKPKITKQQLVATDLLALENWCRLNPGHEIIEGKIVRTTPKEVEPDADALFGPEESA